MSTSNDTRQSVYPALRYRDAEAAIAFLTSAFGFTEHVVYRSDAGQIEHAELKLGAEPDHARPVPRGRLAATPRTCDPMTSPTTMYVVVDDPDARHAQAKAAGAAIIRELEDQDYGSRDFSGARHRGQRLVVRDLRPPSGHAPAATA